MTQGFVRAALGLVGAVASAGLVARQRRRAAGVVALYHRVSTDPDPDYPPLDPKVFRAHCEILQSRYQVLPLSGFVARMLAGESLSGCAAITFDDGYRDFLEVAYPVLESLGLPATHFLVSDCVTSGKPTWNLRALHVATRRYPGARAAAAREAARLMDELGAMTAATRYAWLDAAEAETGADWPAMLGPEDLKRFSPELVDWGSQTVSHATLAGRPEAEVREELARSRAEIAAMTGRPVRYFSYPNGSYDAQAARLAQACGYEAAFQVGQAEVAQGSAMLDGGRFEIPRFDVGTLPASMLLMETTGAVERLRRMVRGKG